MVIRILLLLQFVGGTLSYKIDEEKGSNCLQQLPFHCHDSRFRAADGSCNNIIEDVGNIFRQRWGKGGTCYERMLDSEYGDYWGQQIRMSRSGHPLPNPRELSNEIAHEVDGKHNQKTYSQMLMNWGQLLGNEMCYTSTVATDIRKSDPCCSSEPGQNKPDFCAEFPIPHDDPFLSKFNVTCRNFFRSFECTRCDYVPKKHVNMRTSFIDMGSLYGSETRQQYMLRSHQEGKLKMPHGLFQYSKNTDAKCYSDLTKSFPEEENKSRFCYLTGDEYANNNVWKIAIFIYFGRQHNRMAEMLSSLNPHWNDERLFQEARKIIGAQSEVITYNEFLPPMMGRKGMERYQLFLSQTGFTKYNPNVNPSTTIEFASSIMRAAGHSMVSGDTYSEFFNGTRVPRPLKNYFDSIPNLHKIDIDYFTHSYVREPMKPVDRFMDDVVRQFGQNPHKNGPGYGIDFFSHDVQRGRDQGIAGYTKFYHKCFGVKIKNFHDLKRKNIMSEESVTILKNLYEDVRDIDLYVGLVNELPEEGALMGPTSVCTWGHHFSNLKHGDRYYLEHGDQTGSFTANQLATLRKTTLAKIICQNGKYYKTNKIQRHVMYLPSHNNKEKECSQLPDIDLIHWKEGDTSSNNPLHENTILNVVG